MPKADPHPKPGDWRSSMREAGPYLGLGLQLALTMLFFTGGGLLLDSYLGSGPWITIGGALLGMAAVFTHLFRITREANRREPPDHDPLE